MQRRGNYAGHARNLSWWRPGWSHEDRLGRWRPRRKVLRLCVWDRCRHRGRSRAGSHLHNLESLRGSRAPGKKLGRRLECGVYVPTYLLCSKHNNPALFVFIIMQKHGLNFQGVNFVRVQLKVGKGIWSFWCRVLYFLGLAPAWRFQSSVVGEERSLLRLSLPISWFEMDWTRRLWRWGLLLLSIFLLSLRL